MPQAIPELREKLLTSARKRMLHNPPLPFTMRELSRDCGAALGTAYNYFSSREELMGTVILGDWQIALKAMYSSVDKAPTILDAMLDIFQALKHFSDLYLPTFQAYAKQSNPTQMLKDNHAKLIAQLQDPICAALTRFDRLFDGNLPRVLAEALLFALREENGLEILWPVLVKILS